MRLTWAYYGLIWLMAGAILAVLLCPDYPGMADLPAIWRTWTL